MYSHRGFWLIRNAFTTTTTTTISNDADWERKKVSDESNIRINTANMRVDRVQANHRAGKVPKLIPVSLWDTPARKLGKVLWRMASRHRSSFSFKKTANCKTAQSTLMAQSTKTSKGGATLSSKVWTLSIKTVQTIRSQPPAWQWKWRQWHVPSAVLSHGVTDMPPSSQSQWPCFKNWKMEWEVETGMCQCSTSTFANSCVCTALGTMEWRGMT